MKKTVLKISMLIAGLIFIFTSASWADSRKNGHRKYGVEKRIQTKTNGGGSYHRPVVYKQTVIKGPKHFYKKHHDRHRPAVRYRNHKFYHRNKWIQKHRRHLRHQWIHNHRHLYSVHSYEDDAAVAYNEFSIAATLSEPGGEFSISTKRTW
jgi:hypothetical protein